MPTTTTAFQRLLRPGVQVRQREVSILEATIPTRAAAHGVRLPLRPEASIQHRPEVLTRAREAAAATAHQEVVAVDPGQDPREATRSF